MKTFQEYLTEAPLKSLVAEVDAAVAFVRAHAPKVRIPKITFEGSKSTNVAMYSPSNDVIWVNPRRGTTLKPSQARPGYFSTNHPFHVFFHELGHCAHHDRAGSMFDAYKNTDFYGDKDAIAQEVSRYAVFNGVEFAAEVFAGLLTGKHYSDVVMRRYKAVNGPEV